MCPARLSPRINAREWPHARARRDEACQLRREAYVRRFRAVPRRREAARADRRRALRDAVTEYEASADLRPAASADWHVAGGQSCRPGVLRAVRRRDLPLRCRRTGPAVLFER